MATRIGINLDATVNGTSSIRDMTDAIKLSTSEMKRFQELGDWSQATKEIQNIENLTNAISKYNSAQMDAGSSYSEQAKNAFLSSSTGANLSQSGSIKPLEQRISELNTTIDSLTEKLEEVIEQGDYKNSNNISQTINNLEEEKKRLELEKAKEENKNKNNENKNNLGQYFGIKEFQQAMGFLAQGMNIGSTYRQNIAQGNYAGATIERNAGIGNTIGGISSAVGTGLVASGIGAPVGLAMMLGGSLISTITSIFTEQQKATMEEGNAYENKFNTKYRANRLFYNANTDTQTNAQRGNSLITSANVFAKDTGLTLDEMLDYSSNMARYGITDSGNAMQKVKNTAKWYQSTDADINTMLALEGLSSRYNLGSNATQLAYAGLKTSGMGNGQFNEFLSGLQQVIENGIANGYTKSIEEVNSTITIFSKLSGNNPLWQGENGVNNIMKMNSGLSSATDMGSVSQVIAMESAKKVVNSMSEADFKRAYGRNKTGTYLDYEMALENPNEMIYAQVMKDVKSYSGGNKATQAEFLKQTFGLSTGLTLDLINMNMSDTSGIKKLIDGNKISPSAMTEQTDKQNQINDIESNKNELYKGSYEKSLQEILDVAKRIDKKMDTKNTKDAYKSANDLAESGNYSAAIRSLIDSGQLDVSKYGVSERVLSNDKMMSSIGKYAYNSDGGIGYSDITVIKSLLGDLDDGYKIGADKAKGIIDNNNIKEFEDMLRRVFGSLVITRDNR